MRVTALLLIPLLTGCGGVLDYVLTGDPNVFKEKEKQIQEDEYADCAFPQPTPLDDSFKVDEANNSCIKDLPVYEQENAFALAGMFALNLPKAAQGGVKLLELQEELLKVSKAFGSAHADLTNLSSFDANALLQAPSLPESVTYAGEGIYRMEVSSDTNSSGPTKLIVEFTFLYGDNYGVNKKGDPVKHDLFDLDNYVKAGVATGIFPKFKISFLQTGPLFPLLGLGETLPSPLEVDGKNLQDLTKEFRKLDARVLTKIDVNDQNKCWRLGAGFVSSLRLFAENGSTFQYSLLSPTMTAYHHKYKQTAEAVSSTLKFIENGGGSLAGGVSVKFVGIKMSFNSNTNFSENLDPKTLLSCN